ncbi:Uncharacterised protein [Vibrio cholerae]|nr:Uncharacterised protein [Vibrio cholerae]CSI47803.1 Uncharacterised protein [Vibrio cholerae]CSI48548.1 Uncharacterised protein [Vibrio cholerae]
MPAAKLDKVSCNAKPMITPAIPKPVNTGARLRPICDKPTKIPITHTTLPDIETKKSCIK